MGKYEDLIKRLRGQCQGYGKECEDCNADGNCRSQMENEAADAIEELSRLHEAQRQNLITLMNEEPEPKWIPVTERLPDNDDEVVVAFKNSADGEWWYRIDNFVDGAFCYNTAFGRNITHWMPLPSPPVEE